MWCLKAFTILFFTCYKFDLSNFCFPLVRKDTHFWFLVRGAVVIVGFVVGFPVLQRVFLHLGPRGEGRHQEGQRQPPEVGPDEVGGVVVVVVLSFFFLLLLLVFFLLLVLETVVLNVKFRRVCENIFFALLFFSPGHCRPRPLLRSRLRHPPRRPLPLPPPLRPPPPPLLLLLFPFCCRASKTDQNNVSPKQSQIPISLTWSSSWCILALLLLPRLARPPPPILILLSLQCGGLGGLILRRIGGFGGEEGKGLWWGDILLLGGGGGGPGGGGGGPGCCKVAEGAGGPLWRGGGREGAISLHLE